MGAPLSILYLLKSRQDAYNKTSTKRCVDFKFAGIATPLSCSTSGPFSYHFVDDKIGFLLLIHEVKLTEPIVMWFRPSANLC